MKKILILTSVFWLLITVYTFAESLEIGLKGGMSFSNTIGNNSDIFGQTPVFGYNGGIFADLKLNDTLFFQPEALIVLKGGQGISDNAYYSDTFNRTYLEFPMLLKINVSTTNDYKFNLLTGPYVAFLLQLEDFLNSTEDTNPLNNQFDFGWVFGVSFELGNFTLDGRYDLGLENIYNGKYYIFNINSVQNSAVIISLGYKFLKF